MHILKRKSLSFVMAICLIFSLVTNGNLTALAAEAPEQPSGTGEEPQSVTWLWDSEGNGVRARFNWVTSTDITETVLLYAEKDEFDANGHVFTNRVEGTSSRIDLTPQLASLGYKGGTGTYDGSGSYCYTPVQSHKAETYVLKADTEYVYCVGDGDENTTSVSEPRSFTTPASEMDSFDMLFFSDAQQGGGGYEDTKEGYADLNKTLTQATEDFPDAAFIMSGGDQVNFGFDTWEWDSFFEENQDIFDQYPLYLATGNHECGGDSNGLGWVDPSLSGEPVDSTASALLGRYNPPQNGAAYYGAGSNGDQPLTTGHAQMEAMAGNYYFIYDDTLFMVIDYQDHTDDELVKAEQQWVESVVKSHPEVQWRIAVMHESLFGYRVTDPTTGMNGDWTDTFDKAGVDVVLMGHDHIYTRTGHYSNLGAGYPQNDGEGTTYVTAASANTDNRSDYYETSPYVEVNSTGGYGRAYIALSISDDEIRLTTKGFDSEDSDKLVTVEDDVLITAKPRTPETIENYPEAPEKAEPIALSGVEVGGRAKAGLSVQAVVAQQGALAEVQWQISDSADGVWENIPGANTAYYTCQESDMGRYLRAVVTGLGCYTGTVTSAAVGPVEAKGSSGVNEPGYVMDLSNVEPGTMPEEWTVAADGQFTVSQLPEEAEKDGKAIQIYCDAENEASVSFGRQGSVFYAAVDLYVADWGPITADEGAKYDIAQISFGDGTENEYAVTKLFTWGDCGGEVYMTIDGNYAFQDGGQLAMTETGRYRLLYRFDMNDNSYTVTLNGETLYKDEACEENVFSTEAFEISDFTVQSLTAGSTLYLDRMSITDNDPNQSGNTGSGSSGSSSNRPDVSVSGAGGKVSASNNGTVTIVPDEGYEISKITVNGKEVAIPADGKLTSLDRNDKVVVTFTKITDEQPDNGKEPFTDVADSAWYADAVQYVYENGMMNGTSDSAFSPDATTTRGMIVTILYRLEGEPNAAASSFTDVASNMYYADAINWAAANGIVKGVSETSFAPDSQIAREQMAAILYRYAQFKGYDVSASNSLTNYMDVSQISEYATAAMQWANAEGLITGSTSTTLNPQGNATRAEVATILMRFCENIAG